MIPWIRDLCALAARAVDALESIAESLRAVVEPSCEHGAAGVCNHHGEGR